VQSEQEAKWREDRNRALHPTDRSPAGWLPFLPGRRIDPDDARRFAL
jgi:hypothetical protein